MVARFVLRKRAFISVALIYVHHISSIHFCLHLLLDAMRTRLDSRAQSLMVEQRCNTLVQLQDYRLTEMGIIVTFFCLLRTRLSFSNHSAEKKKLNVESALHNELSLRMLTMTSADSLVRKLKLEKFLSCGRQPKVRCFPS